MHFLATLILLPLVVVSALVGLLWRGASNNWRALFIVFLFVVALLCSILLGMDVRRAPPVVETWSY